MKSALILRWAFVALWLAFAAVGVALHQPALIVCAIAVALGYAILAFVYTRRARLN